MLLLKKLVTAKLLKKFLYLSWNHNIHYCIPNSLPLDNIQSQMKLVHNFSQYHYKIHFNIMFQSMPWSSKSSPSFRFSHNFFKNVHSSNFNAINIQNKKERKSLHLQVTFFFLLYYVLQDSSIKP